jgi:hypothetical protein
LVGAAPEIEDAALAKINILELLCGREEDSAASASSVTGPGAAGAGETIRGFLLRWQSGRAA